MIRRLNRRKNIEIKIIAPLYINSYARELDNDIVSGVYIPRCPKTARLIKLFSQIASPWSISRFSPDIVHETYYSYKPLISSKKVKTVITVYDMIHERFSTFFPYGDKTHLIKKQAVKRADHIICISETTKQDLIDILGIDHSKISVIHLG
ncbi:MAG: glycosyltransferase family 1 protein, partial [Candidatus Electrothrix sp. AR5]|nr:glycosyltransferase family 1 protein [Candidatus Electrothrix sp. AR5]